MVSSDEAVCVEACVREALQSWCLGPGRRRRLGPSVFAPTVLTSVPGWSKVCTEARRARRHVEAFETFDEVVDAANDL